MLLNTAQLLILLFGHRPQEQVETRLFFLQRKNFCRAVLPFLPLKHLKDPTFDTLLKKYYTQIKLTKIVLLNTAQLVILFFGHRPQEQVETRLFFL